MRDMEAAAVVSGKLEARYEGQPFLPIHDLGLFRVPKPHGFRTDPVKKDDEAADVPTSCT